MALVFIFRELVDVFLQCVERVGNENSLNVVEPQLPMFDHVVWLYRTCVVRLIHSLLGFFLVVPRKLTKQISSNESLDRARIESSKNVDHGVIQSPILSYVLYDVLWSIAIGIMLLLRSFEVE